jgi:purine-nucleoside phosphorylase
VTATEIAAQRIQIGEAAAAIRAQTDHRPEFVIVPSADPGELAVAMTIETEISYEVIPHFPQPAVATDAGRMLLGTMEGRPAVMLAGHFHRYDGHSLQQATLPVRVAGMLGADTLLIASSSCALHPLWARGDLVVLDDHINLLGDSPLIGPNLDDLGPRFPDMSEPYDHGLQALAEQEALAQNVALRRGVYAAVTGPSFETRAEYRMLRALGADLVGTGVVPEVIVARHMGMRVLGLSIVVEVCLPDALEPVALDAIARTAREAEPRLARLVRAVLGHRS